MNWIKNPFFLFFLLSFSTNISAQYITVSESYTAEQLVRDILINNPCATVSNISATGLSMGSGDSFGYFAAGTSTFPFANGVILSTGRAASAVGPNASILSDGPSSWVGDADLEQALQIGNSVNATVLEFDFIPQSSNISFDYIFASEEYHGNAPCRYSDGFAFLLREKNSTTYKNLALIPNSTTPVKVTTVHPDVGCPAENEQYFGGFNGPNYATNFNGQTVIMKAQSDVIPGTEYHIKLVIADETNFQYDSAIFLGGGSFRTETGLGPDRLIANGNPLCYGENLLLNATPTIPGTYTYQWNKNNAPIPGQTNATYTITNNENGEYSVTITGSACSSDPKIKVEFLAPLNPTPAIIYQCDENSDGTTAFNLTKADSLVVANDATLLTPVYYENITDAAPITNPTAYTSTVPKTIYAKVSNSLGCSVFIDVKLEISNNSVTAPSPISTCDGDDKQDGLYHFDLDAEVTPKILIGLPSGLVIKYYNNSSDAISENNQLPNIFDNTTPDQQIIWARITNGPDCYGVIPVTLIINTFTAANFDDENVYLCEGVNSINLSVASGYSSYLWDDTNHSITASINAPLGTYSVTVSDANGCTDVKKFTVLPSGKATIDSITINDFNGGNNTIIINFSGIGDYEFSLDGQDYQDEPIFTNVPVGRYKVYVKDKNKCGITTENILVLDYPKFFTPNGDGFNDVWKIDYLQLQPKSRIIIFDRYGKIIYSFNGAGSGWDGKLNSKPLPADDYWFMITLQDNRIIKGHFALKR